MASGARFDARALRAAFGHFATGVTIIATREADGTPRGFTANSFTSVSLDPPLLLVCIGKAAASVNVFTDAARFSVNVLSEAQKDTSGVFASRRADKFDVTSWSLAGSGVPLITGSLAWFDCARHNVVDAGDHVIIIGRVEAFGQQDGRPLGYYRGNYFSLGVEDPLVDMVARSSGTIIGAVYDQDGAILLEHTAAGLVVPSVGRPGERTSLEELRQKYRPGALETTIEFLYGVFEDRRSGSVTVYYRGHAKGPAPEGTSFYALDDIPWDDIGDTAMRTMLRRYVREVEQGRFGLYMGNETTGIVKPLD